MTIVQMIWSFGLYHPPFTYCFSRKSSKDHMIPNHGRWKAQIEVAIRVAQYYENINGPAGWHGLISKPPNNS